MKSERPGIYLNLDPELRAQVDQYQAAIGLGSPAAAVRALLHQALSASQDPSVLQLQREVLNEARHWLFEKVRTWFEDLEKELQS